MLEIGFPPDRVYQAQLEFEIDGKRYHSFYECDNKKMTQVLFSLRHNWVIMAGMFSTGLPDRQKYLKLYEIIEKLLRLASF